VERRRSLVSLASPRILGYWEKLVAAAEEDSFGWGREGGRGGVAGEGGEGGKGGVGVEKSLYHVTLWHSAEHSVEQFDEVCICARVDAHI